MKLSLCTITTCFFTINGDKEIKKISQNFLSYTSIQVILPQIDIYRNHDIFITIDHLVIIFTIPQH